MRILVHVSPDCRGLVTRVRSPEILIDEVSTMQELADRALRQPPDAVVVDPMFGGQRSAGDFVRCVTPSLRATRVPVVLYCGVHAETLHALAVIARTCETDVMLRGFDDTPAHFREILCKLVAGRLADSLVASLLRAFGSLPPGVVRLIEELLRHPDRQASVDNIASTLGVPRRTLDRWLARTSLPTATVLLRAARVLHAYVLLQSRGVRRVAQEMGYQSEKLFSREVRTVAQLTPSGLRQLNDEALLRRILGHLETRCARRPCAQSTGCRHADVVCVETPNRSFE